MIESSTTVVQFADVSTEMPVLIGEDLSLGVGFNAGVLGQAQAMPDVDVLELVLACRKGFVKSNRLGMAESILNPVSTLDHFYCFFGANEFLAIFLCVRH